MEIKFILKIVPQVFKMKHQLLLVIFCFTFILQSCGQGAIKVISIDKKGDFIIPPNIRSILTCKGNLKSKYYDFVIRINNLDSNYNQCLNNISKADICEGEFLTISGEPTDNITPTEVKAPYCFIKSNSTSIEIKIHFHKIFHNPTDSDIAKACQQLSHELLTQISQLETTHSWAPSISQNIIEKVFELIPIAQEASLARYIYVNNQSNSSAFILLNPKLSLELDLTNKREVVVGGTTEFKYQWTGLTSFNFKRDEDGKVKQNDFAHFPNSSKPNNLLIDNNIYLISSFADIASSNQLKDKPYVAYFQPTPKRNNGPKSDQGPYFITDDKELLIGNSFLVHFTSAELSTLTFANLDFTKSDTYTKTIFGERNSAKVFFTIFVNNSAYQVQINSTLSDLTWIPENAKIYRKFGKLYKPIKLYNNSADIKLLPFDQIIFKP